MTPGTRCRYPRKTSSRWGGTKGGPCPDRRSISASHLRPFSSLGRAAKCSWGDEAYMNVRNRDETRQCPASTRGPSVPALIWICVGASSSHQAAWNALLAVVSPWSLIAAARVAGVHPGHGLETFRRSIYKSFLAQLPESSTVGHPVTRSTRGRVCRTVRIRTRVQQWTSESIHEQLFRPPR